MPGPKHQPKRWTQHVTQTSNALDLEPKVFAMEDPRRIAMSPKALGREEHPSEKRSVSLCDVYVDFLHQ